jgi:hypothetical protein
MPARFMYRGSNAGPASPDASLRLSDWTRTILRLGEDDTVSVSEIACGEPACGGAETVVLVMRAGRRTEAAKVKMGMALVTEQILREALAELGGQIA